MSISGGRRKREGWERSLCINFFNFARFTMGGTHSLPKERDPRISFQGRRRNTFLSPCQFLQPSNCEKPGWKIPDVEMSMIVANVTQLNFNIRGLLFQKIPYRGVRNRFITYSWLPSTPLPVGEFFLLPYLP